MDSHRIRKGTVLEESPKTGVLLSDDHLNKEKSEKTHCRLYSAKRRCNATERPMETVTVSLERTLEID